MAIVGVTDTITPGYARIGKLRKGGEKNSNGYGPDLDYFRFTSEIPDVAKAFAKIYPNRPREIRIFIPHDTVEQAFSTHCELWSRSGLQHRCDGQTMYIWREGSRFVRGSKPCLGGHKDNDPHRDAVGRLEFVIPQLVEAGFVGCVTMETHSLHDILNISRVLAAVQKSAGTLAGVEFILRRVKENIGVPGFGDRKNDRSRVDKWLVRLEPSREWVKWYLKSQSAAVMRLPHQPPPVAIAPPKPGLNVDPETGEILDEPPSANSDLFNNAPGEAIIEGKAAEMPAAAAKNDPTRSGLPGRKPAEPTQSRKAATIKARNWSRAIKAVASKHPKYRDAKGNPSGALFTQIAYAEGYKVVTDDNLAQAIEAIRGRIEQDAQDEQSGAVIVQGQG